jgi:type I restriction enzyme S subunit
MTTVPLREVVSVIGGGTPRKSSPEYYGGSIPWVTPKDMKRSVISSSVVSLTELGVQNSPAKLVPASSVLVVVRSGVLKHTLPVALTSAPVTLNQDMKALVPKAAVHAPYLARLVKSLQPVVLGWVRATTADNFPIDQLLDYEIDLPVFEEQRRIAAILDHADNIRAQKRSFRDAVATLKLSAFEDLFGSTQPTAALGDCGEVQGGLQVSAKRAGLPIELPYLRVANVYRGRLDLGEVKTIRATEAEAARTRLEVGDLLFVEGHANPKEVGRIAMWDGSISNCVHQNHLIRVRLNTKKILPDFADIWFNSNAVNFAGG